MKSELSKADQLLIALTDDYAPPVTIRQRCEADLGGYEEMLDALAGLIRRGLVVAGLARWSSHGGGWRYSYCLTEHGRTRKDRLVCSQSRHNQELFAHV